MRFCLAAGFVLCLTSYAATQKKERSPKAEAKEIHVRIVCTKWGKEVPRRQQNAKATENQKARQPFMLVGHRILYEIDSRRFETIDDLKRTLKQIHDDPKTRFDDPKNPGQKRLPPIVIDPGPDACYADVISLIDAAAVTGFADISPAGMAKLILIPMSVRTQKKSKEPLYPKARYCVPDDEEPAEWMPRIQVLQDGSYRSFVVHGGQPVQRTSVASIEAELERWRKDAKKRKFVEKRPKTDGELITKYILIAPDKWTRWRDVKKVIDLCRTGDVRFWKFNLAVGDTDQEADQFARQRRAK